MRMSSVVVRSVIAPVGTPPDQKKASIEPSRSAATDSPTPSPLAEMSSSGSSPATASRRFAITSVPEFGEPIETLCPRRSSSVRMPESAIVATCVMLGYSVASARSGSGASNDSRPSTASIALSESVKATSEAPSATRMRLSTEADVVSAVVGASGSRSVISSASPPP
jgi:hypothetical protein